MALVSIAAADAIADLSRFGTIIDRTNANEWTPLANLSEDQASFYLYDSLLSEYAALGFEYGYSVAGRMR